MEIEFIQECLQQGLNEGNSINTSFDILLESAIRDIFLMNRWDEPEFTELIIPFKDKQYKINIEPNGCCEATNEHRIMYWKWTVNVI